ncbi:wax ester/triacylglycerol synthase domain-containing protein [Kitasatospora purpeofusca]|uniref:wax ester/triacylglycerol synthase domain-containing protein n=1 Tax=Kitasatospora purpeofusca TaxID=67352 RepID=UPI0036E82C1C
MTVAARSHPLATIDRCFLAYELERPAAYLQIGGAAHMSGPSPGLDFLREHVRGRLEQLPVLGQRITGSGPGATWEADPGFDLTRHVRQLRVVPGPRAASEAVDLLRTLPLPADAPPWDLWLVHGYAEEEYLLCYRVHHAAQDGLAAIRTIAALFSPRPLATASPASRPARGTRQAGPRDVLRLAAAVGADLLPTSPWWAARHPRSGQQLLSTGHVPRRLMADVGSAVGGGVNDVYLAALAATLRRWVPLDIASAPPRRSLHAMVPVSTRALGEPGAARNQFGLARIPLPWHEASPLRRLRQIADHDSEVLTVRGRRTSRALFDRLGPGAMLGMMKLLSNPGYAPLIASHVPFPHQLVLGDSEAVAVIPHMHLPDRHPLSVCLCTYRDTAQIAFVADRALPGAEQLGRLWAEEVLLLARETGVAA